MCGGGPPPPPVGAMMAVTAAAVVPYLVHLQIRLMNDLRDVTATPHRIQRKFAPAFERGPHTRAPPKVSVRSKPFRIVNRGSESLTSVPFQARHPAAPRRFVDPPFPPGKDSSLGAGARPTHAVPAPTKWQTYRLKAPGREVRKVLRIVHEGYTAARGDGVERLAIRVPFVERRRPLAMEVQRVDEDQNLRRVELIQDGRNLPARRTGIPSH